MKTKKRTKIMLVLLIIIIGILLLCLLIPAVSLYRSQLDGYRELTKLEAGYSNGKTITLGGKTYTADPDPDLENYCFKSEKPETVYHVIASSFKPVAVMQDFAVESYRDDPNGYILKEQKDIWGFSTVTYYSSDFRLPAPESNSIRQLLITFAPIEFPSAGYTSSISGETVIREILACIQDGDDPTALIQAAVTDMPGDSYRVWVDYPDFPMYQLVYSGTAAEPTSE